MRAARDPRFARRNLNLNVRLALLVMVLCLHAIVFPADAAAATPPVPSQPSASCDAMVNGQCYVSGAFSISAFSSGAHHYKVCRSSDTMGWGGCSFVMTQNTGSTYTVSGSNLPSDGFRRAYYFSACDSANNCTSWGDNPEAYVTMDTSGPTQPGPTSVSCAYAPTGDCWVTGNFTASVAPSTDSGSGVDAYQICRSLDASGGWAGCDVNLNLNGGTSINVTGTHLPANGSRRAYYFRAKDNVGNWGPWNTPRYVRIDRNNPTVSASNASPDWFTSRTATISAADATAGASANSGLTQVRYRWNAALNGTCTNGTVTSSGTTLTAPAGDNTLHLCAKDNTGRVGQWNGTYRVDSGAPTQPGPTTVSCAYAPTGDCWVTGDFNASVTPATDPSGIDGYQICRSQDSLGGFAGCDVNLTLDGGTSINVTGSHLASDGFRRAYYFRAKDNTGNWGPWNTPRYVRVDRHNPTVSANNASPDWFESRTATIAAADAATSASANSGLAQVRFRWNAALNGACTNGNATSQGATLDVPEGDNVLYLCAKDHTGRVGTWNGIYRVDAGAPSQPGPTTVNCALTAPGECWVTGDFVASVTPATDGGSGVAGYQICRSLDSTGGWEGCNVNLSLNGGTSITVSGNHLPTDGFRRAYYFRAKDNNGNWGPWNTPRYVRIDRHDPTVSADNASSSWFTSRTATLSAADTTPSAAVNTGLAEIRYRWNTALNGACTNGTVSTSGASLTVPEGDNTLYLCARDNAGRVGQWNGQYRVDTTNPTRDALTVSSSAWSIADSSTYDVVVKGSDTGSGVRELRALINYQGSNNTNRRGNFSWRHESLSYLWTADQVLCTGGGFASKHPTSFNPGTITLVGCSTSLAGNQRTVTFTVLPNTSFGEFGAINDISSWVRDFNLNQSGWGNWDLNFSSFINTTPPKLRVSSPPDGPLAHNGEVSWGVVEPNTGSGNQVARTLRVLNSAAAGASNLLLVNSPSNVEIQNTQGSAFSWTGELDSPLTPGQSDDFLVHMNTSQVGNFEAVLKIWHNDFVRPVPLRIQLRGTVSPPEPTVTSVERSPVLQGQVKIIIVRGSNLHNATVNIGTDAPEEGDPPPSRVYPTAELVTINSGGTRLEARIDATATGVDGFYNLGIETPGGMTGAQFRVVGPEPVIDLWTPSEPVMGRVHVLQIAGVNLQDANVVPMSAGVKILDINNDDDRSLSGLMFVSSGAPSNIDLRIDGLGGSTMLPLIPRRSDSDSTKATHKIDTTGSEPGQPTPHIYIQEPVSPHSGSELLALGHGTADEFAKSINVADLDDAQKNHFCLTISAGATFSFSAILLNLSDSLGDPLTQDALNALLPGQSLDFSSLTVAVTGFIQFDFFFRVCETGVTDLRFCIRAGIGVLVPAIGGWSIAFDICFGINDQQPIPPQGQIDSHQWSTTDNCVRARDLEPLSVEGERINRIEMDCCADATIGLQTSGVAFNQNFNVGGPVAEVMPINCTPPTPGQFKLFLDVDNDNGFDPNTAVPINDLDDLDDYVPGSKLDGSSIANLASTPQEMKLVAAYVDIQGNNAQVVAPPPGVTGVEFVLTNTSAFVGVASNWPVSGGSTAPDFHLGSGAGTDQMTVNFAGDHTARVDFVATDYGAITTVEASPDGGATREVIRIPKDDDSNMLPDAGWKLVNGTSVSSGGLTASADRDSVPATSSTSPALGRLGDGLSVYEEYRGFMVRGTHRRVNPVVKDVFMSSNLATGVAYAFPNLPTVTHRINGQDQAVASEYDAMRDINFNKTNSGQGGDIPGHSLQKAIRGLQATTTSACLFGRAFITGNVPDTPNRTQRVEVYTAQHSVACGIPAAQASNEIRRSFGHEVGHAMHICHRPGTCPDGSSVGTGLSIMSSPLALGANAQGDPASQYNALDQAQIRLHANP